MSDEYHLVELRGGPADGEVVRVQRDLERVRVVPLPVEPARLSWEPRPKFRALTPVHVYRRDVNNGAFAFYDGDEQ